MSLGSINRSKMNESIDGLNEDLILNSDLKTYEPTRFKNGGNNPISRSNEKIQKFDSR